MGEEQIGLLWKDLINRYLLDPEDNICFVKIFFYDCSNVLKLAVRVTPVGRRLSNHLDALLDQQLDLVRGEGDSSFPLVFVFSPNSNDSVFFHLFSSCSIKIIPLSNY